MEKRNVSITLEKAIEWYKQGGGLREVALQAYREEELINWPIDINDPILCLHVPDCMITPDCMIPGKVWYQWKLYKLLELLNPRDFNPGYSAFYVPRIWWYKNETTANKYTEKNNEINVGRVFTNEGEILYINIGGASVCGSLAGVFAGGSDGGFSDAWSGHGAINQLKCATHEIQKHLEKYFWKDIIKAYYGEIIIKIEETV